MKRMPKVVVAYHTADWIDPDTSEPAVVHRLHCRPPHVRCCQLPHRPTRMRTTNTPKRVGQHRNPRPVTSCKPRNTPGVVAVKVRCRFASTAPIGWTMGLMDWMVVMRMAV